jgi:hypothetical protein
MVDQTARSLGQPIAEDGIRWLNAFNGRSLSAEDIRTDQTAVDLARRQLGRAAGSGVLEGLIVSEDEPRDIARPVLAVEPGLAFNLDGQALQLGRRVTIGLVRVDAPTDETGSTFARCDVVLAGTSGLGAYVLAVGPAETALGKASVAGLGNDPAACNTALRVEGVRFQLVPVDIEPELVGDVHLRNVLAYRMYGEGDPRQAAAAVDPYTAQEGPRTGLDDLQAGCLGTSDVPLALLFWRPGEGVDFIDLWAVRRRLVAVSPASREASPMASAAVADAEARYLQFEADCRDWLAETQAPATARLIDRFRYLPPVGVVPIATLDARGFDRTTLFEGLRVRGPAFIEAALVPGLLRAALDQPAIDVTAERVIWTYLVRENAQQLRVPPWRRGPIGLAGLGNVLALQRPIAPGVAIPVGLGEQQPSCVVFATGDLRYLADARFDLQHWSYANHAEIG